VLIFDPHVSSALGLLLLCRAAVEDRKTEGREGRVYRRQAVRYHPHPSASARRQSEARETVLLLFPRNFYAFWCRNFNKLRVVPPAGVFYQYRFCVE